MDHESPGIWFFKSLSNELAGSLETDQKIAEPWKCWATICAPFVGLRHLKPPTSRLLLWRDRHKGKGLCVLLADEQETGRGHFLERASKFDCVCGDRSHRSPPAASGPIPVWKRTRDRGRGRRRRRRRRRKDWSPRGQPRFLSNVETFGNWRRWII